MYITAHCIHYMQGYNLYIEYYLFLKHAQFVLYTSSSHPLLKTWGNGVVILVTVLIHILVNPILLFISQLSATFVVIYTIHFTPLILTHHKVPTLLSHTCATHLHAGTSVF